MSLLHVRGLTKTYRGEGAPVTVFQDLTLQVQAGEFVTIFGASGSGKSTLLHILGGLDHPTAGEVEFANAALYRRNETGLAAFRNREVGFIFQFYHLLPEFTALENVMLPCLIGGVGRREGRARAERLLADVGLRERAHHRPHTLSGGEQQRVAIARALVQRPRLLLADEPTGNLDETTGAHVMALLQQLWSAQQTTIVMVTHNPDLIRGAKRKLELRGGQLHEMV